MLIGATGLTVKALWLTVRFEVRGFERVREAGWPSEGVIFVFWHESILLPLGHESRRGCRAVVSAGRDGDFAERVLARWFGIGTYRGSSSRRGQVALLQMIRQRPAGTSIAFTPDGPRGPRYTFRGGPALTASHTGLPVVAIGAAMSRGWFLKSWDRFKIPKPFSRVALEFDEPVALPEKVSGEELERWNERLKERLEGASQRAATRVGVSWPDARTTSP